MFTERLNTLMAALEISSLTLAKHMGCDRSNIDRFRKSIRVPQRDGKSALRIVEALYTYADDEGKTDVLLQNVPCADASSGEKIREAMMMWLFEGEKEKNAATKPAERQQKNSVFGQKLNAVMELIGLSNSRLGKLLHVDPSYISRFRSGLRSPVANPRMADKLCWILLEMTAEQNKLPQLAALMQVPGTVIEAEGPALRLFRSWLFNLTPEDPSPLIRGMLDQIGSITEQNGLPMSFDEAAPAEIFTETDPVYFWQAGLRRAVLRFLGGVVRKKPEKLLLYSDQNMDWMVADPIFRAQWGTLMLLVVNGGTQIRIIHNIDRDLTEMAAAIRSWLPLYPSGMIRSYYNKVPNRGLFSETLFLCPGVACISGANVRGTEDDAGLYRFDTDPAVLAARETAFRAMLENAGELAHVEQATGIGRFGGEDVTGLTVLGDTLSLATMPEETLFSALDRAGADEAARARLHALRRAREAVLVRTAGRGFLHELIPLPSVEALQNGSVPMDLPGLCVAYTPEDFASHVKNVLALSEAYPQYRFFPLPEPVFPELRVLISDAAASVVRLRPPALAVRFSHPELCRAFVSFAEGLRSQYKQDRLAVKQELEQYL